jgi:hypothetical protein
MPAARMICSSSSLLSPSPASALISVTCSHDAPSAANFLTVSIGSTCQMTGSYSRPRVSDTTLPL